jgi:hypothetical protein
MCAGAESPLVTNFCHYHLVLPGFEVRAWPLLASPQLKLSSDPLRCSALAVFNNLRSTQGVVALCLRPGHVERPWTHSQ